MRVEYVWYECPMFDEGRITFSRPKFTNDGDVRTIFATFRQHNKFSWIDTDVTLLTSPEDILNSLIPPEDYDQVASLLCSVFILLEFKFSSCYFAEDVGIEVSYIECSDLQASLKSQKIKRTQHVLCRISYIGYDIKFLRIG